MDASWNNMFRITKNRLTNRAYSLDNIEVIKL